MNVHDDEYLEETMSRVERRQARQAERATEALRAQVAGELGVTVESLADDTADELQEKADQLYADRNNLSPDQLAAAASGR